LENLVKAVTKTCNLQVEPSAVTVTGLRSENASRSGLGQSPDRHWHSSRISRELFRVSHSKTAGVPPPRPEDRPKR